MTDKQKFDGLLKYHQQNFKNLKDRIAEEEGYLKLLNEDDFDLEFRVASQRYLLSARIIPREDQTVYETYKIERDPGQYGNFKFKLLEELNMATDLGGGTSLAKEIIVLVPAAFGAYNKSPLKHLSSFGKDYIYAVLSGH